MVIDATIAGAPARVEKDCIDIVGYRPFLGIAAEPRDMICQPTHRYVGLGHGNPTAITIDGDDRRDRRQLEQITTASTADVGDMCRPGVHVCAMGTDALVARLFESSFGEIQGMAIGKFARGMGAHPRELECSGCLFCAHQPAQMRHCTKVLARLYTRNQCLCSTCLQPGDDDRVHARRAAGNNARQVPPAIKIPTMIMTRPAMALGAIGSDRMAAP